MSDTVPDSDYQQLHHFISQSPWNDQPVRRTNAQGLDKLLGRIPYSGLLIDETAFSKKGVASIGVARQWNGQLGKIDNCQVAVFSALCDNHHAALLDARLYLPESWTDVPERCSKAGIPGDQQAYKPKTQLALDLIDQADAFGLDYAWVGVDAGYGKDPAFLRELVKRGKTFFADVHKTQLIYPTDPTKKRSLPGSDGKQKRLTLMPKPMRVADWVACQPKRKWKKVFLRYGSRGKQMAKVLHGHVWVWDGKEERPHAWHLIVRRRGSDPSQPDDKYTLSNAPCDMPTKPMAWYQGQRFKVEQSFQEAKQELGMDDYQVRGWRAWHHHVSINLVAMHFLLEEKLRFGLKHKGASLRSIREMLVALLPKNEFKVVLKQVIARAEHQEKSKGRASPK